MGWLEQYNLSSYLDVHQCPGVLKENTNYLEFCEAVGVKPDVIAKKEPIHIEVHNQTFVGAFFEVLLERQTSRKHKNVYYWIDYNGQPPEYSKWNTNWAPTAGVDKWKENHFYQYVLWNLWQFYLDMERRNGRGSNLAWYGGIGSQRYPLGHSGDVICSWDSLRFQSRFTSTAANVAFGYWSHDLGGHRPNTEVHVSRDPELYLRWIQLGVFLPTLRTHMVHGEAAGKQPSRLENVWRYDERYAAPMSTALRLRGRLVPYLYTAAMMTYQTGVSIVHPVYYDYPTEPEVHETEFDTQFLCGDDLFIAPIRSPQNVQTNVSTLGIYLPGSNGTTRWVEFGSLRVVAGGQVLSNNYTLDEPGGVFVKEGSILPMTLEPSIQRLSEQGAGMGVGAAALEGGNSGESDGRHPFIGGATHIPKTLVWETWVGNATSGTGFVAEDNHTANAYAADFSTNVAITNASFKLVSRAQERDPQAPGAEAGAQSLEFDVSATTGQYGGMATQRNYEIRLHGVWPPAAVHVLTNGNTNDSTTARLLARRQPHTSCGKLRCSCASQEDDGVGYSVAGWWWDASTMTAFARVDDVDVKKGVSLRFDFNRSLQDELLHSPAFEAGFPTLLQRATTIKQLIDLEAYSGALPSIALNRLVATADRMQADPSTAAAEIEALGTRIREVVALHTGRTNATTNGSATKGLPSMAVQSILRGWLGQVGEP
jgi:hypothetical protein